MSTVNSFTSSGGTAALAATFSSLLAFLPAPTVSAVHGTSAPIRIPVTATTPISNQYKKKSSTSTSIETDFLTGIESAILGAQIDQERKTTEVEMIVGTFREWFDFKPNWDGEGATAPLRQSLDHAANFISSLAALQPLSVVDVEPLLHSSGHAGLFWNKEGLYVDLEFLGNEKMVYFIERGSDRHKGSVQYDGKAVPSTLRALLKV